MYMYTYPHKQCYVRACTCVQLGTKCPSTSHCTVQYARVHYTSHDHPMIMGYQHNYYTCTFGEAAIMKTATFLWLPHVFDNQRPIRKTFTIKFSDSRSITEKQNTLPLGDSYHQEYTQSQSNLHISQTSDTHTYTYTQKGSFKAHTERNGSCTSSERQHNSRGKVHETLKLDKSTL